MAKKITHIKIGNETYQVGSSGGGSESGNFINQVDDFSQYVPTKWNEIAQYVGADTPQYKNGYFYKYSGGWIIPVDSQQIAFQSITEGGEHAIPIVSPLYEGLSSRVFAGSNAYYGMLRSNTPTVSGKIIDFLTGTINTITAVTDNGDETYICVTDGGAREETTTYTLDMTEEFDYEERVDAYKNRFIVIDHTDISDYPSSMFGFYIVEETDPNTGTLVDNYYPAELNGCVASYTTAPVVIDEETWTQIDVQPTSSAGTGVLIGYFADQRVSIVPYVSCIYENGKLFNPLNHEEIPPEEGTYYYDINGYIMLTLDENDELFDVTNSVLVTPEDNQIVIDRSETLYSPNAREYIYWYDSVSEGYHPISDRFAVEDYPRFSEFQTRENLKGDGTEQVLTLWGKIKKWFSDLKDLAFIGKPSTSQTTTYLRGDGTWQAPPDTTYSLSATNEKVTLTPSQGSASDVSLNTLINGLSTDNTNPQDNDYLISQYAGGGTTTTTYHRRPLSKFWNWIKSKLGSVGSVRKPIYFDNGVPTVCGTFATLDTTGETIITTIGADLNDYTTVGVYGTIGGYGGSSVADSLLNRPSDMKNGGIKMVVQTNGGSSDYIRQIIYHKNGDIFTRTGYLSDNSYTWLVWKQVNDTDTGATSVETTGSGNAVTSASYSASNRKITLTKGSTFLTSHQDISGKVDKSGDTITGTLILSKTQDASGTANNKPALIIGGTDTQAHIEIDSNEIIAKSDGTTEATLYLNNGNGNINLQGSDYSVSNSDKFRTAIGAGTSSLTLGTTATTAAKGNHAHTLSIAADSGTNALTLAAATKYKITAGGNSFIFTTPSDTNTWRPLGTGASDACAGNDSRLSNSRPASDVYSWAKASTKPSYTASEVGAMSSATESKTSTTWYNGLSGTFNCYKIGRIVIGYIGISSRTTQFAANNNVCLLPYTPSQSIYFPVQNADTNNGLLGISSDSTVLKTVTVLAPGTSFYGMFCYVATS